MEETLALNGGSVSIAYVAYYGRPADPSGRTFWAGILNSNNINYAPRSGVGLAQLSEGERNAYNTIINAFGNSAESVSIFDSLSLDARINQVYEFSFGRSADQVGLSFWSENISNGSVSLAAAALEIALGATGEDLTTLSNRIASADLFTENLVSRGIVGRYVGPEAEAIGREFIAGIFANRATPDDLGPPFDRLPNGMAIPPGEPPMNGTDPGTTTPPTGGQTPPPTGGETPPPPTQPQILDLNRIQAIPGAGPIVGNLLGTLSGTGLLNVLEALITPGTTQGALNELVRDTLQVTPTTQVLNGVVSNLNQLISIDDLLVLPPTNTNLLGGLVNGVLGLVDNIPIVGGIVGGILGRSAEPIAVDVFNLDTPLTAVTFDSFAAGII